MRTTPATGHHHDRPLLQKDFDIMATDLNAQVEGIKDEYKYGFRDSEANYSFKSGKGLTRETVEQISEMKSEPGWMRDIRLKALEVFWSKPNPIWGGSLD